MIPTRHVLGACLLLLSGTAHASCTIYFGSSGYDTAGRVDADRGENCTPSQLGLAALVL